MPILSLPGDNSNINRSRIVEGAVYSTVTPEKPSNPTWVHQNFEFAKQLGIELDSEEWLEILSGKKVKEGTEPYALCYGGHQFGHWAGQLGDGRAINLFDVKDDKNQSWTLQLKGAGPTPYSRSADGFAVLRSSIREYLMSEAMYHLGVPTTRALSLIESGDKVLRDMFYNGNSQYEPGAIVCRVAPSFLRFGSYQIFTARKDIENLTILADYTIKEHFPSIQSEGKQKYLDWFKAVTGLTLEMIIHWQRVGFVHGVMNTDNMSILGLTIDYGPYGWTDDYNQEWTPNTTDAQGKRYRFGNQPEIALWNLLQLANAIYPLIDEAKPLEEILNGYKEDFESKYLDMMREKIGLISKVDRDFDLIAHLEKLMSSAETDMTIFFRELANIKKDTPASSFEKWEVLQVVKDAFYTPDQFNDKLIEDWNEWLFAYVRRLQLEDVSDEVREHAMNQVNPKYVLRNYMAQVAIDKAEEGDYSVVEELFQLIQNPYAEQPEMEKWYVKRPDWARNKPGSSMLSCSS